MVKKITNNVVSYVIGTNLLFWIIILFIGVVTLLSKNIWLTTFLVILGSWTPTMIFLIMFKYNFPDMTVKGFYKQAFSEHINWLLVLAISIIIVAIYAVGVYLVSVRNGVTISSMLTFSLPAILNGFFPSVLEGATGEETGWRGFLLPSIEKKVGLIKGSLIVGVIWSFWHAPLWFLTTGYAGLELLEYIIAFIISIVSFSLIIGICYNHCHNLFIPIWMHFMFNFSLTFYVGRTVDLIVWLAVFYVLTALGFVWWHKASVHGYNPR